MTPDRVVELAKQAGFRTLKDGQGTTPWHRFASLVEQATLNRVADQFSGVKNEDLIALAESIRRLPCD